MGGRSGPLAFAAIAVLLLATVAGAHQAAAAQAGSGDLQVIPLEGTVDHEHALRLVVVLDDDALAEGITLTYQVESQQPRILNVSASATPSQRTVALGPFSPGTRIEVSASARRLLEPIDEGNGTGSAGTNTTPGPAWVLVSAMPIVLRIPQLDTPLWHEGSTEAFALAKVLGRPVVVATCGALARDCTRLRSEVLGDPQVLPATADVILAHVDATNDPTFAPRHNLTTLPALVAFDAQGAETDRFVGVPSPAQAHAFLQQAAGRRVTSPPAPPSEGGLQEVALVFGAMVVLAVSTLGPLNAVRRRGRL